jgi:predicted DNA-binding transcriptional regulator AlpA
MQTTSERLSRTVAAAELGKTTSTLDRWRRDGLGPRCIKEGKSVVYTRADLDAWKAGQVRNVRSSDAASAGGA